MYVVDKSTTFGYFILCLIVFKVVGIPNPK